MLKLKKLVTALKKQPKAVAPKAPTEKKAFSRHDIASLATEHGVDFAACWLTSPTQHALGRELVRVADDLGAAKTAQSTKVLVVEGDKVFAWPLVGLTGDTYTRMHGKMRVNGSINLLRRFYKPTHVQVLTRTDAQKVLTTTKKKVDADCKKVVLA